MEERHLASAVKILRQIKYMTIATVCADGAPWNTPVVTTFNEKLIFRWGSGEQTVHSQNIRKEKRVFAVIYDSTVPEGLGEGVYMKGDAEEMDEYEGALRIYLFKPEQIWINVDEKNADGSFKRDLRVELDLEKLRAAIAVI